MALVAGLHGNLRLNFCRAGKASQFGVNFKVRIIVDNDLIKPFRRVTGKVVVETRFPIKHKEMLLQFEGLCTLRYTTKIDNRTSFHQGRKCILENVKPEIEGYQKSPIQQTLLHDCGDDSYPYVVDPGSAIYIPFSIEIPGNLHLPRPFKNSLGNLVYRLVVYMKSTSGIYVEVGEKIMRFNGHHNLLENVEAMKPITMENFFRRSIFYCKKLVEVVFSIDTPGCLPGESIQFSLYVKNAKCIPIQSSVQLVKQIKYDATGKRDSVKQRFVVLEKKDKEDLEPQPELTWMDSLYLEESQEVSVLISCTMLHIGFMSSQYSGIVKGQTQVFIGTTRDPIQTLMSNANGLDVPFHGFRRRGSAASTHSVRSHQSASTTYSLPPAYSQLSSRIPSVESLPPSYDEAELLENTQRGTVVEIPSWAFTTAESETDNAMTEDESEINGSDVTDSN